MHDICADPSLNDQVPLTVRTGVTKDISAFLLFQFWQQVLYLDHEDTWPAFKERTGRWVCVTENIGDMLTCWILDEQSKQLLARSVVCPLHSNRRVKFDPSLDKNLKRTATNGGDIWPIIKPGKDSDQYDDHEKEPEPHFFDSIQVSAKDSTFRGASKPPFCPSGEDTYKGSSLLRYNSTPIREDPNIPRYPWIRKKSYKKARGMEKVPLKMDQDPYIQPPPRKSLREMKEPNRLTFTSTVIQPLCFAVFKMYDDTTLVMPKLETHDPIEMHPKEKSYTTFAYNCRIDAYNQQEEIRDPERDTSWDIKTILDHRTYKHGTASVIKLKVQWTNGEKTWETLQNTRRHDISKVLMYALHKKLTGKPGWKWATSFVEADTKLNDMKSIYLASKLKSKFKFGVEAPMTPKHALQLDDKEQNGL